MRKLSHRHLVTVLAFWLGVGMANAYFVKWSVITRMSLSPVLSGSNDRKSMQTSSRGLVVFMFTKGAACSWYEFSFHTPFTSLYLYANIGRHFWPIESSSGQVKCSHYPHVTHLIMYTGQDLVANFLWKDKLIGILRSYFLTPY